MVGTQVDETITAKALEALPHPIGDNISLCSAKVLDAVLQALEQAGLSDEVTLFVEQIDAIVDQAAQRLSQLAETNGRTDLVEEAVRQALDLFQGVEEQKTEIAGQTGEKAAVIGSVMLDIERMRRLGILVDIDIHGLSKLRTRTSIPKGAEVVLLGDGEYDSTEMVEWVQTHTDWFFVLRTAPSLLVQQGETWHKVATFAKQQECLVTAYQVTFTQTAALSLNLVAWWGATYEEPIYLITNLPNGSRACWFYKRRFRIETFFSDQKSRGFHIHKSHLSDPIRISRLLIAACLAYIWMICLGLFVIAQGKTGLIDRTDRIDKSLFRLGLDWLKHVLKRGLPFDVYFSFQPAQFTENVR